MVVQPTAAQRRNSSSQNANAERKTEVTSRREAEKIRKESNRERDYTSSSANYANLNSRGDNSAYESKGNRSNSYKSSYVGSRKDMRVTATPPSLRDERHLFINSNHHQHGYVWVPGYWTWNRRSNSYFWTSGYWLRERKGYVFYPGYWEPVKGGYIWIEGGWFRV